MFSILVAFQISDILSIQLRVLLFKCRLMDVNAFWVCPAFAWGIHHPPHHQYCCKQTVFYYSFHIYYHLKILITLFSSKFSKYLVNSKYRLFKEISDISYFFRKKRENGLSVYYISIVLLTKEGKVDTLLFEFNKMYNH